jgi:hypothetical protein
MATVGNSEGSDRIEIVRRVARWAVLVAAAAWGLFAGGFLVTHSLSGGFIVKLTEKQFGAMIMVPMAALMALCIVIILEWTAGQIEFKGLSFEFRGASGPIVLWVFCFLAIVSALRLFWIT